MKALEILNSINKRNCTDSVIEKINKAIKELEALNNRSCDSCNCNINKARCDECSMNFNNLWESK